MSDSKRRVLLVNPWIVDFAAYDFWIKPVGLLIIGQILRENGYTVDLLDCMDRNHFWFRQFEESSRLRKRDEGTGHFYKEFIRKPEILKDVPRRYGRYGLPLSVVEGALKELPPPDVILVTSGMTYWYLGVVEMISLLKKVFRGVPVILGGIYATLCPEHAREFSGAYEVVVGDGVPQGLRIVDKITGHHSDATQYENNNEIPIPLYDLYDGLDSVALLTSQGCPYRCPFCASHLLSKNFRRRGPSSVIDEIESLHRRKGVREFAFYDDALLFRKEEHLIPILEELIERKMRVHFHTPNGIQPGEVDERLAYLMKKTGFRTIRLSYETINKERQESMGFKVNDEDLMNAVRYLTGVGFDSEELGSYVLMGLPGQEVAEVLESILFVLSLGIKVSLASFSPIPGTRIWQEAVDQGLLDPHMDPLLTNNSVFPVLSKELTYKIWLDLGTLSAVANRILSLGGNPLKAASFSEPFERVARSVGLNRKRFVSLGF